MRNNRVSVVVRTVLVGAACAASLAPAARAAEGDSSDLSEIVVTGSRVRGEAPIGSAVTTLGRKEIETSPSVTVDRLIQELPQVFDLGVSENSRGQPGGAGNIVYANSINLRGIGPARRDRACSLLQGPRLHRPGRVPGLFFARGFPARALREPAPWPYGPGGVLRERPDRHAPAAPRQALPRCAAPGHRRTTAR